MTATAIENRNVWKRAGMPRGLKKSFVVIIALLSIPVAVIAILSGTGLLPLPYEMFLLAERMPYVFKAHMVSSAFALLLAPVVIAYRKQPGVHRMLGRVLGAFVVVGGMTALPVAVFSHSTFAARAGFFVQGLVWLALLVSAIIAIRKGYRAWHVKLMLAMVAVTTGAVWFRLFTGAAIYFQLPFEPIYAVAAWAGWLLPLSIVLYFPGIAHVWTGVRPLAR